MYATSFLGAALHEVSSYVIQLTSTLSRMREMRRTVADFDALARSFDNFAVAAEHGASQFFPAASLRHERALDIGCGTGRSVCVLANSFHFVVGVDISTGML